MNLEGYGFLISVISTAVLVFVLFLSWSFSNFKQLRSLKNELNEIRNIYSNSIQKIKNDELQLAQEKEKLLMHTHISAEGICFFNPDRTVAFYNGLFLQYFNMISYDSMSFEMLKDKVFDSVIDFLNSNDNEDNSYNRENYFETQINRSGNVFSLRVNLFKDKSFEIILINITAKEKTRRLKQELTGNIAHELRTPVTGIRGFLEIVLNNKLDAEKSREYLERAFSSAKVLSELISDMSLLAKIDENAESIKFSNVNIFNLLAKIQTDVLPALNEANIEFNNSVPENILIKGNENLIHSIFKNLTDNAIHYAGKCISINIKLHEINEGMAYFIFSDTGKGIEKHIYPERLFERFYRLDEGRTRNSGGSGLGLSIVKNAVLFHKGTITVRNRNPNGLEFIFSLPLAV